MGCAVKHTPRQRTQDSPAHDTSGTEPPRAGGPCTKNQRSLMEPIPTQIAARPGLRPFYLVALAFLKRRSVGWSEASPPHPVAVTSEIQIAGARTSGKWIIPMRITKMRLLSAFNQSKRPRIKRDMCFGFGPWVTVELTSIHSTIASTTSLSGRAASIIIPSGISCLVA